MFAGPSLTIRHRGDFNHTGFARFLPAYHTLVHIKLQLFIKIAFFLEQVLLCSQWKVKGFFSNSLVFKLYFIIMLLQFSQYFPVYPPSALHPPTLQHPPLNSCPWVVLISSLNSLFPVPFLTSPRLFYAYQLCFFFPVPFPPILPLPLPTENPPCDFYFSDSVPVLVVGLVFVFIFFFFFMFIC